MMAVEPQTSRFWQAAVQSGLVDDAALRTCWDALPEAKRTPDAIDRRLARQAVSKGYLTIWQAQQILAGRGFALKIGKYVLLDLIGQGGMGRVYLARDSRLKRQVALKILSRERMSNPRALARFEREAKVGAQLQHDNLVRIYDEGEAHGLRFLVMEFIEGKNIGQILAESGPLHWATASKITRQVALGLQHAHEKGLIHRDVNPSNILVTRDGTAKLTDLGLAIDLADLDDIVTRDGATVGTFDYISPEQARHSRGVDGRSDIYSLGCSFYHMIAGRVPFPTPSLPEKLYAHQLSEPEPLSQLVPGVPVGLDAVVSRMMHKKVEARFQQPMDVAHALEPYMEGAGSLSQITRSPVSDESPEHAAAGLFGSSLAPPAQAQSASDPELGWKNEDQPTPRPGAVVGTHSSETKGGQPASAPAPAATATAPQPLSNSMGWMVDLGPEPPITESLSGIRGKKSKSKSKSKPKLKVVQNFPESWPLRDHPLTIAAGVLALMTAVVLTAWVIWNGPGSAAEDQAQIPNGNLETPVATVSEQFPEGRAPFALLQSDGKVVPYSTLDDALRRAGPGRGQVLIGEVGHDEVLEVASTSDTLEVPGRPIVIRAAEGCLPTLNVRMSHPSAPLFRQREGSLSLSGIQFRVSFEGERSDQPTAPLLTAFGRLELDRCSFVVRESRGRDTVAVRASNQGTTINGCLFRGFDCPLDLDAIQGTATTLRHCIMIWPKGASGQAPGWAIRARAVRTQGEPSQIVLERCSVLRGQGLLQLSVVSEVLPLRVELRHSVVRAFHLLCWDEESPSFPNGLQWSSEGNVYDLSEAAWVVTSADGLDHPVESPSNLESWREMVGGPDAESSFSGIVELRDERVFQGGAFFDAQRYRLDNARNENDEPIGADPDLVGPLAQVAPEVD